MKGQGGVPQVSTCLACTSPCIHPQPQHQEINQSTERGGYLAVSEVILEIKWTDRIQNTLNIVKNILSIRYQFVKYYSQQLEIFYQ